MKLGYTTDDNGVEHIATTTISTRIRALEVKLLLHINKDVSYPLSSAHNRGFHIKVHDSNDEFITELNIEEVTTEQEVITAVTDSFVSEDAFVMITTAAAGETFAYQTQVYNQTAIDNKSYDSWDEDAEDLEDNADEVAAVFLNDELRWEVGGG